MNIHGTSLVRSSIAAGLNAAQISHRLERKGIDWGRERGVHRLLVAMILRTISPLTHVPCTLRNNSPAVRESEKDEQRKKYGYRYLGETLRKRKYNDVELALSQLVNSLFY